MPEHRESSARGVLRVGENVGDAVDRAARNFGGSKRLRQRGLVDRFRPSLDDFVDGLTIGDARTLARESRIARQLALAHEVGEAPENPVVGAGDGDPATILGRVVVVGGGERRARAHPFANRAGHRVGDREAVEDAEYAFVERDVDDLAASGRSPLAIGDENAEGDEEPAHIVGDGRRSRIGGRAVGKAAEIGQPPERLGDPAEAGQVLVRAVLTVAGNTAHDDGRVDAQIVVADAPAFERPGTEILKDDIIAVANEVADDLLPLSLAQITGHRLLVARLLQPKQRHALVLGSERTNESPLPGISILTTSAPNSARIVAQNGAAMNVPRSSTLRSARGFDEPVTARLQTLPWRGSALRRVLARAASHGASWSSKVTVFSP